MSGRLSKDHRSATSGRDLKSQIGWEPDGKYGNTWVEVKDGVHNARDLRSVLVNLAYTVNADPGSEALAVLMNSRISESRLSQEMSMFESVVSPSVASRIKVVHGDDPSDAHGLCPEPGFAAWLGDLMHEQQSTVGRSATKHAVAGLLYLLLLRQSQPVTAAHIGQLAGASHPTVAHVLKELEASGAIERSSGEIHFKFFPKFSWTRWLNVEVATRKKVAFADRSGHARSPESMARRLAKLDMRGVAVGGLLGARHHYPGLDLAGSTRLDLVVHGTSMTPLSFVNDLDPALELSRNSADRHVIVVHFLPRNESFFATDKQGNRWADPIVCMADLQEAGFDHQAEDLLQKLTVTRG
ncbi:hypothetical protein ACSFA0_25790 [Variovorax sp. LT1P1]|uniref:hypothetical protein n=1 Tax=Variovorax sp. LT1P1 TaxID=3443730 RepID=UPI003F44BE48